MSVFDYMLPPPSHRGLAEPPSPEFASTACGKGIGFAPRFPSPDLVRRCSTRPPLREGAVHHDRPSVSVVDSRSPDCLDVAAGRFRPVLRHRSPVQVQGPGDVLRDRFVIPPRVFRYRRRRRALRFAPGRPAQELGLRRHLPGPRARSGQRHRQASLEYRVRPDTRLVTPGVDSDSPGKPAPVPGSGAGEQPHRQHPRSRRSLCQRHGQASQVHPLSRPVLCRTRPGSIGLGSGARQRQRSALLVHQPSAC
jgi:hypothetical protein